MMAMAALATEQILLAVLLGIIVAAAVRALDAVVCKLGRLQSRLGRQGILGPAPSSILLGNIPDIKRMIGGRSPPASFPPVNGLSHSWPSLIFPHLKQWRNEYGSIFMYAMGNICILSVTDMEMVKELSLCTSLSLGKPSYLAKDMGPLLGEGILTSNGKIWVHQRKIISPELYLDKVKGMMSLMVDSTSSMLRSWETKVDEAEGRIAEINVDNDLRSLSADIISKACFGSSYHKGEEIFSKIRQLQKALSKGSIGIPGMRYIPTKENREMWKLEKEIRSKILDIVRRRTESDTCEKDLLQMILEGADVCSKHEGMPSNISRDKFITDNCKNLYFAGHETTAVTASWSLVMLAAYPEWQDRARAEVIEAVGCDGVLSFNKLRGLKILTMVIQETLRLYPPAVYITREALADIEFKNIVIPKGLGIQVPVPLLHQDPEHWGHDAAEFNPWRFSQGISGACNNVHAYFPFGAGPRVCAGQHFAMVELKVILSLILLRFGFSLSRSYKHSPAFRLVIEPGDGVTLQMNKLYDESESNN